MPANATIDTTPAGDKAGFDMIHALVMDRDFQEALRLANEIRQLHPKTRFYEDAVELSAEIPKRLGDFKTLTLPTHNEWAKLKAKMSRAEQVAYLAERIRLVNCYYDLEETQFAEWAGPWQEGPTRVIHPLMELQGGKEFSGVDFSETQTTGLQLTVADIPALAPFLRDDWHLLCYFCPRVMRSQPVCSWATSSRLFAVMINSLAKRDLCRLHAMAKMSDAEIEDHIQGIVRWAKENAVGSD